MPSEIAEKAPRWLTLSLLDSTWALGSHDHGTWVRDPWDQHLWTLNEKACYEIMKAEWWLGKAKEKGLRVDWEERKLLEAKKWLPLGQNSDKFSWEP
nr:hypothetical protein [Candidatus Bathyarchaeota archaeon]